MQLLRIWLIVIASVIIELAWLKEEEEEEEEEEDRRFAPFSDLPMWHSAMVSSNANSLFADENTREWLVGFIKACDYI